MYTQANEVKQLAGIAFPEYSGRTYRVEPFTPTRLDSYWSGGSRDYYRFVHLVDNRTVDVQENGTPFSNDGKVMHCQELPPNVALVQHSISCGKDVGITIYVRPENFTKLLPAPMELTRDQRIVLSATRSLKSSYGGIKDYRFHEAHQLTGIDQLSWDQAKAELIAKGLIRSNGAITDDGRNAIGTADLYSLRQTSSVVA